MAPIVLRRGRPLCRGGFVPHVCGANRASRHAGSSLCRTRQTTIRLPQNGWPHDAGMPFAGGCTASPSHTGGCKKHGGSRGVCAAGRACGWISLCGNGAPPFGRRHTTAERRRRRGEPEPKRAAFTSNWAFRAHSRIFCRRLSAGRPPAWSRPLCRRKCTWAGCSRRG